MGQTFKKIKWILIIFSFLPTSDCFAFDVGVLQAFIELHKSSAEKENEINLLLTTSTFNNTTLINPTANDWNGVRNQIDDKMRSADNIIAIVCRYADIVVQLGNLIKQYKDFATDSFKMVKNNPAALIIFNNANASLMKEINYCNKMNGYFVVSETNLLRSTGDKRFAVLNIIRDTIVSMRSIIYEANKKLHFSYVENEKELFPWDIITPQSSTNNLNNTISLWDANLK